MMALPWWVWALEAVGVLGIPALTCAGLYRGARAAGLARRRAGTVTAGAAVLLGGWIVLTALLAGWGVYHQQANTFRPWIVLAFLGVLGALLAAVRIPVMARIVSAPGSLRWLALPHALRVVGVLFLLVWALGALPAVFALPAGLGDIAIGLAAPGIARRLAWPGVPRHSTRRRAVWFNLLGLVDLAVAIAIGFLAGIGPVRPLQVAPSTELLSILPLALVATVAVPVALALHLVSLRLLAAPSAAAAPSPTQQGVPA